LEIQRFEIQRLEILCGSDRRGAGLVGYGMAKGDRDMATTPRGLGLNLTRA
jgi:hypothetical protein